jgi:hypothetical protein
MKERRSSSDSDRWTTISQESYTNKGKVCQMKSYRKLIGEPRIGGNPKPGK